MSILYALGHLGHTIAPQADYGEVVRRTVHARLLTARHAGDMHGATLRVHYRINRQS